jgi:O-antigen ligase
MTWARIEKILLPLWVVLITSESLNIVVPYVHWFATIPLLIVLGFNGLFTVPDFRLPRPIIVSVVLLVVSIMIVALVSDNTLYDLSQAARLSILFLILLPPLISRPATRRTLWVGVEAAVLFNFILIIGGLTINPALFGLQAAARFGTYANGPGALWRVGVIGLAAATVTRHSNSKLAKLRSWFCAIVSLALIFLDGSRTGVIVLSFLLLLYVPAILKAAFAKPVRLAFLAATPALLAPAFLWLSPSADDPIAQGGIIGRLQNDLGGSSQVSASSLDPIRSEMYRTVFTEVQEHPFLGLGMEKTKVFTVAGSMVVHFSFLQVWSDVGLVGFLSYTTLLSFAACMAFKRLLCAPPRAQSIARQCVYLTGGWIIAGCFHPISSEMSVWIWFFLALALIADCPIDQSLLNRFSLQFRQLVLSDRKPVRA